MISVISFWYLLSGDFKKLFLCNINHLFPQSYDLDSSDDIAQSTGAAEHTGCIFAEV